MQVPVDRIEQVVRGMFADRDAVTRDEVMRASADAGLGGDAQSFLAQLPPGAFTQVELLGDIRTIAASYAERVPTRTSDRDS